MNIDHTVIAAREQLARAEADRRAQHRADLVQRLEAARAELIEGREEYKTLATSIKSGREFVNRTQMLINQVLVAIDESWRHRPQVAEFLPKDPEVIAWSKRHKALERERDKLIASRDAATPNPQDVLRAVAFEGPSGIIARLEHTEQNLLNDLNGSIGKLVEGGVFSV